jgi:hypothetical protein
VNRALRTRLAGTTILVACAALVVAWPATARAKEASSTSVPGSTSAAATPSVPATSSKGATYSPSGGYILDFTLPTYGKAGCLVCHGDPKLVVSKTLGNRSFWIDEKLYDASAHGTIMCTGCHVDYGYSTPHGKGTSWRMVAKQACKNCHVEAYRAYSLGSHAARPQPDGSPDPKAAQKPLCGDCHGSHYMPKLKDNPAGQAAVHGSAQAMCGRAGCHADYWDNYSDYYHGAAYKRGAPDAPACWQCHDTHQVLPTKNPLAPTNVANLGETCGQCHEGATEAYTGYTPLIHQSRQAFASNPVYAFVTRIAGSVAGLFTRE